MSEGAQDSIFLPIWAVNDYGRRVRPTWVLIRAYLGSERASEQTTKNAPTPQGHLERMVK